MEVSIGKNTLLGKALKKLRRKPRRLSRDSTAITINPKSILPFEATTHVGWTINWKNGTRNDVVVDLVDREDVEASEQALLAAIQGPFAFPLGPGKSLTMIAKHVSRFNYVVRRGGRRSAGAALRRATRDTRGPTIIIDP